MGPLLELADLEIDYSVAPLFPIDRVVAARAFVFRIDTTTVHLALAMDLEAQMRGNDYIGSDPMPHTFATELARWFSGRNEVLIYQISDTAFTRFLREVGQRTVAVLNSKL